MPILCRQVQGRHLMRGARGEICPQPEQGVHGVQVPHGTGEMQSRESRGGLGILRKTLAGKGLWGSNDSQIFLVFP